MFCSYIGFVILRFLLYFTFHLCGYSSLVCVVCFSLDACSLSPETVLTELEHVREERDSLIVQLSRKESEDSLRVSV